MHKSVGPRQFARNLGNSPTPAERKLWHILSAVRPRFMRQLRIDPCVADLACRRARLIVEPDGSQHVENATDTTRTKIIENEKWVVLRFWNIEVMSNAEGVAEAIIEIATLRLPPGETFAFVASRTGRARQPRSRNKTEEPPPAPPARAGGEEKA